MTTINIDLSSTLQTTLSTAGNGTGTYVYAFAFGATTANGAVGLVDSAMVVSNGALTSTTSLDVTAGQFYSGGVYVVIQQGGTGNLLNEISSASDIIQNATAKNYSYQLFEATLSGSQYDLGDISAVNTFGFTSTYEVVYQNGSDTRGFNTTADSIFASIPPAAVSQYTGNQFPNADQLATGPATADDQAPWASSGWQTYVNAVKNSATTLADIEIVYSFQGGSPLQSGAMLSQYSVEYVASDQYGDDYFWLVPDTSNGATNTDWIRVPVSQLVQNIFIQPGSLEVHKGGKGGKVITYDSFTPDNAVGGVAKHFVAGFDAGFWGGQGVSANALDNQTFDFNKGYNWNVNYAYDAILLAGVGSADFENTLVTNPGASDFIYDPWAQQFVANSNAYGYSYSDLVSAGGVNPQIALWDTDAGANVETINITIYDTDEIPATGYQASSTGYVAPAITGYEAATTADTLQIGFDFNFSVGSTMFAPDEDTPIVLKIYAPGAAGADGDGFISLDVTGGSGANTSDWYYYIINSDATNTWAFDVSNATGEDGFFNIQNLPTTVDGSVAWYQLVFGAGDDQTIYNIYYDPSSATAPLVVDHGIGVMLNPNGSYTLSFAPGGHMFYDIDTFTAPPIGSPSSVGSTIYGTSATNFVNALESVGTQAGPTDGADTIYGRGGRDYLSGLGGNDTIDGGSGIDMLRGNDGDDILQVRGSEGIYDYFHGGEDTDTLQFVGTGIVTLNGLKAGTGSVEILQGNGRGLYGTSRMDVFDLSALNAMSDLPFIDAHAGNDILTGSDFADDLRGGAGNDTLNGGDGADTLLGGTGNDTLNGDDSNDILDGGVGADALNGGDGDDTLRVRGNEGLLDTFNGGIGTDTLQLIGRVSLKNLDTAASSIEILQGAKIGLYGTALADTLNLSGLTSAPIDLPFIDGGAGNDVITGSGFADDLRGGAGNDTLNGGDGADTLLGGTGNDTLNGDDGSDILDGGIGADALNGGDGDDTLRVRGNEGLLDTFNGGIGTDTLQLIGRVSLKDLDTAASSIEILQGAKIGLYGTALADTLNLSGLTSAPIDVPFVDGGAGNDVITGSDFADNLRGGTGDDTLNGGDGTDTLLGGVGNDTLNGDDGADTLDGGAGVDTLNGGDGDDILQVRSSEGIFDTFNGGAGTDTLKLIGNVTLAGFDAAASSIEGLQGSNLGLYGTNQVDVFDLRGLTAAPNGLRFVDAGGGNDTLLGSDFDDDLRGGAGNDRLDGGLGNDILDGGAGSNTYVFADGYGQDTLVRFNAGKDAFDMTGVTGVNDFSDLVALMDQVSSRIVEIDFGGGDTLTIRGTTIAILTANQDDFLF